jgi:ABC-2 type transport system ATP-binding protein
MPTSEDPLTIETFGLTRRYGSLCALDKATLQVARGHIFGLLGPNGAGKSTLIKILTTLLPPTAGEARILGHDLQRDAPFIRSQIGYVPQLLSADGDLTGYENLLLSAQLYGMSHKERKKVIQELLAFMGLTDQADRLVSKYSGGMIRKLEIAQALVHSPQVLFLDEPTVGLDPAARQAVWEIIQTWRDQFKTTIFMTTHDMIEADVLCDTVAFLYLGKIVALDSPAKLKAEIGSTATLNDVFIHYTERFLHSGENYDNIGQTRRTISRL